MSTLTPPRPVRQRRSRPPQSRSLKLLIRPDASGPGLLKLTVGNATGAYWLRPIDSDMGGRAYELRQFRSGDVYHVRLASDGSRACDCAGGCFTGHCKHADACAVLAGKGVL